MAVVVSSPLPSQLALDVAVAVSSPRRSDAAGGPQLCAIFLTLAARLAARTYDAEPWGTRKASPIPSCEGGASGIIFLLIS
jgi:hypothetical protein